MIGRSGQGYRRVAFTLIVSQFFVLIMIYHWGDTLWTALHDGILFQQVNQQILQRRIHSSISAESIRATSFSSSVSDPGNPSGRLKIALGLGILMKGNSTPADINKETGPFLESLMPSFCRTCSLDFSYHFFLAFDYDDPLLSSAEFRMHFEQEFLSYTSLHCPTGSDYFLHLVKCNHHKSPAWAQNDAMIEAYLSGMDYLYRINDDTKMRSSNWTEIFIARLDAMIPPLVGVVGPLHRGGNPYILTYDFTHRTHLDIFGYYYPREFPDWHADHWITDVYTPGRSFKLERVKLLHTQELGKRYNVSCVRKESVLQKIENDKTTVTRYVHRKEEGFKTPDPSKVISMSLDRDVPSVTWGAVRNAQLVPVVYPGWSLRIYVSSSSEELSVSNVSAPNHRYERVLDTLRRLNAQVVEVDNLGIAAVPRAAWSYLIADDPDVDVFLIRDPTARLCEREAAAVEEWLAMPRDPDGNLTVTHSMRDHTSHYNKGALTHGLWGAHSGPLSQLLGGVSMRDLLHDHAEQCASGGHLCGQSQAEVIQSFLNNGSIWEKVITRTLWHDSLAIDDEQRRSDLPGRAMPFPKTLSETDSSSKLTYYVGQKFDEHEIPVGVLLRTRREKSDECSRVKMFNGTNTTTETGRPRKKGRHRHRFRETLI